MQKTSQPNPALREAASCLHLVAGAGSEALAHCLSQADLADAILFIDAGVLHLASGPFDDSVGSVHFSAADLQAHGLFDTARRSNVDIVDDAGFCELLAAHRHCLTWT
jgi:sulfur relay protein TusB/DsrH